MLLLSGGGAIHQPMKASRSLTPGGWFHVGDKPPPGLTGAQFTASAGTVHGQSSAIRYRNWLFIGGVILMLAGRPSGGADAVGSALVDDSGLSVDEFTRAAAAIHTKDAPSDAQVLQRIRNSAGLRGTFSLTRNYDPRSAGSDDLCELLMGGAPRGFLSQLTLGENGLIVFVAGAVGPHFEKLSTWSGQSGAGVLYPINSRVGLFVDARTVTPNGTRYYGITRAGLRISF